MNTERGMEISPSNEADIQLEELFHKLVSEFKLRWLNKGVEISRAGLYNYAMSVMRYEFYKKFDKESSERLVDFYKP